MTRQAMRPAPSGGSRREASLLHLGDRVQRDDNQEIKKWLSSILMLI